MDNIMIGILEQQKRKMQAEVRFKEFGLDQLRRLNSIIEEAGGYITEHLWGLLLFNVNSLVLKDGYITYTSTNKTPSKKILKLFKEYNNAIVENIEYIAGN